MNSNNQFYNPYPDISNNNDNQNQNYPRNRTQTNHQVSEEDFKPDTTQQAIARDLLNNVEKKASSWYDKFSCDFTY